MVSDDGGGSGPGSRNVTVNNVAPADLSVGLSAATINENGSTTLSGTFTDPGTLDVHTVYITWSDGSDDTVLTLPLGARTYSASHQYLDDGASPGNGTPSDVYTIFVKLGDDDTGAITNSTTLTVNNRAPADLTVSVNPAVINENGSTTVSGSFSDVGTLDAHTLVIDWGDGTADTVSIAAGNPKTFSETHTYLDDGASPGNGTASDVHTISVTVTDDDTGSASTATSVTVNNAAPVITAVTGPALPTQAGTPASVTTTFTDVGTLDGHTCTYAWGDSTANTTVTAAGTGNGSCTASHTYAAPGLYTVTVTVTDDDTGSATSTTQVLVFGYATGGSFVVGNQSATGQVNYWGAQWSKNNSLSGGNANNSFKGFVPGGTPACGSTWTSGPGNSTNPPSTVPTYMAVVVSSSITKTGNTFTGNIVKIVIVKTGPGYSGNPGHDGNGTVVATLCGG